MILSKYIVVSPPVVTTDTDDAYRIVLATRSAKTLVLPARVWQLVVDGDLKDLPESLKRALSEALILVADDENELASVLAVSRAAIASTDTLYECIQPTAACQLGCDYCGQQHRSMFLSEEHRSLLALRINERLASGQYKTLRVGWFGGEPLIALSAIRKLTVVLRDTADKHGCKYSAHLVTNGYALTQSVARELTETLGVREIEVTLDGPQQAHDGRRYTKSGEPTFDRIFRNILAISKDETLAFRFIVRCNVDGRNAHAIPELIELLAKVGLQKRIALYFAPIHDWGNSAGSLALDREEFANMEVDWFALMGLRGFEPPLIPHLKPVVCMAVNPNAEMIDPYGQRFNCTEVSLVPGDKGSKQYSLGTLARPMASSAAEKLGRFLEDIERGAYGCTQCAMLPVCGGACPKQWRDGFEPCPSAKRNMPDRLVLALALQRLVSQGATNDSDSFARASELAD